MWPPFTLVWSHSSGGRPCGVKTWSRNNVDQSNNRFSLYYSIQNSSSDDIVHGLEFASLALTFPSLLLRSHLVQCAVDTPIFHKRNHFDVHEVFLPSFPSLSSSIQSNVDSDINIQHLSSPIPSCFIFQKDFLPSSPRRL